MSLIVSIVVFLVISIAIGWFGYRKYVLAASIYENLETPAVEVEAAPAARDFSAVSRAAEYLSSRVRPSEKTASALRLKLMAAGYRTQKAVPVFYGLKLMALGGGIALTLLFVLSAPFAPFVRFSAVIFGGLLGFVLPDYFLNKRIRQRKKKLRKGLPDALDLIVVCAEAGLTIDRCFRSVSHQLDLVHPVLCDEFGLFTAEINAGLRRKEALENMAERNQEPELRKLVSVLMQADRFGTSIADALRTHAEYLRIRRMQEAEEKAAKVGVKLIFPIFFFIMPTIMLISIGPAAIMIASQLGALFGGGGTH